MAGQGLAADPAEIEEWLDRSQQRPREPERREDPERATRPDAAGPTGMGIP